MGKAAPLSVSTFAERVQSYLRTCARIDTRALAGFRIVAGLLIVADILLRSRNFHFFYTDDSVITQELAQAQTPDPVFSVYFFTSDPTIIAALFVLTALVGVQLLVGYKTRVATILAFLLVMSLDHHNPLVTSYADTLFRLLLFWAIFLPLGERWSIDAVHRERSPREAVASIASALILLQMVTMYVGNSYHKLQSDRWGTGEVGPTVMGLDHMTFLLGDFMRNFPTLLEYGGLLWFAILPFGWLLFVVPGRKRLPIVLLFVSGHVAFAVTVRIGAFAYVSIAGLLLFVQTPVWEDTKALLGHLHVDTDRLYDGVAPTLVCAASRVPDVRVAPELQARFNEPLYAFVLYVIVLTTVLVGGFMLLQVGGIVDTEQNPEQQVETVAEGLGIDQPSWSIFGENPSRTDRYYVFPAKTADGEHRDVYHNRELTYERPYDELQRQYGTYRERFYLIRLTRTSGELQPSLLGEYYCTTWAEEHDTKLTHVNMYVVYERVTVDTIDDPEDRERWASHIYSHGCGDNEPREIDPPDDLD